MKRVARHGAEAERVVPVFRQVAQRDHAVGGGVGLPADGILVECRLGDFRPCDERLRGIGTAERDLRPGKLLEVVGHYVDVGIGRFRIFIREFRGCLDCDDIFFLALQVAERELAGIGGGLFAAVERVDVSACTLYGLPANLEARGGQLADNNLRLCDGGFAGRVGHVVVRRACTQSEKASRDQGRVSVKGFHISVSLLR